MASLRIVCENEGIDSYITTRECLSDTTEGRGMISRIMATSKVEDLHLCGCIDKLMSSSCSIPSDHHHIVAADFLLDIRTPAPTPIGRNTVSRFKCWGRISSILLFLWMLFSNQRKISTPQLQLNLDQKHHTPINGNLTSN